MDTRIASVSLSADDVIDLLYGYDIRKIEIYDLGLAATSPHDPPTLDPNRFTLDDCARVVALGVKMNAQFLFNTIAVGRSNVLQRIPTALDLRMFTSSTDRDFWNSVVDVYELMRYQHRMGATLATALLHLKRPTLIPVLLEPSISLYTQNAMSLASEMRFGVPLYWEAVRQDLLHNEASFGHLRGTLAQRQDSRSEKLLALSDLRLTCILAEQYGSILEF